MRRLRKKISKPFLIIICAALFIANTLNVAADLSGMSDAANMLTGARVGILGVGFLAIPTLTGSAAYALAETFAWKQGLNEKFVRAQSFTWRSSSRL